MIKLKHILNEIQIEKTYFLTNKGLEFIKDMNIINKLTHKYPNVINSDTEEYMDHWFLIMMNFDEQPKLSLSQIKNNVIKNTDSSLWEENKDMINTLIKKEYIK